MLGEQRAECIRSSERFTAFSPPAQIKDMRSISDPSASSSRSGIDGAGLIQTALPYVEAGLKSGQLVTVLDDFAPPPVDGFFLFYEPAAD